MILWACVCYLLAGARSLMLGVRRYPFFSLFMLLNGLLGIAYWAKAMWYCAWWDYAESICVSLQLPVTLEAYARLTENIPNLRRYRWNVFGILGVVGVGVASALTDSLNSVHHWASIANQAAGFVLGVIAVVSTFASLPFFLSRNSRIHAAVLAWIWLISGAAYLLNAEVGIGRDLITWGPAAGAVAWVVLMRESGEAQPPADPPELVAAAEREIERQIRKRDNL